MENNSASKYTVSFGLSLALCSVVNALLVIAKEKDPHIQVALKKLGGHHWTGHSIVVIALFALCGWLLTAINRGQGPAISVNLLTRTVLAGVAIGVAIIVGFYLVAAD
jgi:hypothetical protein